ncbi:hypothetical protein [Vibrio ziniensis]|uniref:Uncharacterized protein n=1 Tax=Vibrio ziniensis TaxID=2711221 RepID=A0A6G7CJG3_9VIBR|nr:hypothetical protein [Vibrio ziniensis]QIH42239.1 hypothetical protein G5S32_09625 [Vibrio ziniensis]
MLFSTFLFIITMVLAVICAQAIGVSNGELPLITLMIPALWMLPKGGISRFTLLVTLLVYGFTLSSQPAALSICMWMLFPICMVAFSRYSNRRVVIICGLIVVTLLIGVMFMQSDNRIEGTPWITAIQVASVLIAWWVVRSWKPYYKNYWWALGFVVPMIMADLSIAALVSLSSTGMIATMENLQRMANFKWGKLLCWGVPTIAFTAILVNPNTVVSNFVLVVWGCLLATAWLTDYILRSSQEQVE